MIGRHRHMCEQHRHARALLPALKPYADVMTGKDITDCEKIEGARSCVILG